MDRRTDIDYDRAAQIATDLLSESQKMVDVFNTMKNHFSVVDNGSGVFDGTAATEIRTKFNSFADTFHHFNEAVESYAKYIQQAAINYQNVDKAAQSAVTDL